MANDASEIVIAKGGKISVADSSTTNLPTDVSSSLNGDFADVGYITEDGATVGGAVDITEVMAWQAGRAVRRDANRRDYTLTFGMEQWTAENLAVAFGGGVAYTVGSGETRFDFPDDDDALDELAMVVEWTDHGFDWRLVFPKGNVTEAVEANLIRTGASILPVTFSLLESPPYLFTDAASFGVVS